MNMHINARGLSQVASQALVDAAVSEAEAQGPGLDRGAVESAVAALLPYWREWDRRGGFAPGADCAALFAAWERETAGE